MKDFLPELARCALFEGLTPGEVARALEFLGATELSAAKGRALFHEGDPMPFVGPLLSGAVHIFRGDPAGQRSVLVTLEPGDLLGDAYLCAGLSAAPASAVAVADSRMLALRGEKLLACADADSPALRRIFRNLNRGIARKNLLLNRKIYFLTRRTTREKVMAYLLDRAKGEIGAEFVIPYDRQSLADYLGVDRSAMSVEIGKLRRDGIIECAGSRFRILKPEG